MGCPRDSSRPWVAGQSVHSQEASQEHLGLQGSWGLECLERMDTAAAFRLSVTCTREPWISTVPVWGCVYTCAHAHMLEMEDGKANVPQARGEQILQTLPKLGFSWVSTRCSENTQAAAVWADLSTHISDQRSPWPLEGRMEARKGTYIPCHSALKREEISQVVAHIFDPCTQEAGGSLGSRPGWSIK